VLVLHGWALDSGVWLASRACSNTRDFRWAYFDFPGYGVNREMAPAQGVDGMARAALQAIDDLGWTSFSVLGHSMGGVTALRIATLRPSAVTATVALTPVSPGGTPLDAATFAAFDGAWSDPGAAIKASLSPRMKDDDLRRLVDRNRATMDRATWTAYLKNWTSPDFMGELGVIQSPVTLLYGETDPFVSADYLRETVGRLPHGRLLKVPGAGHYPMIEATEATQTAVEAALGG
jgi:pimeloyl-ACP methyl ester carboxylesterase